MRVLAFIFGVLLLFPGLCAIGFIAISLPDIGRDIAGAVAPLILLWIVCFAISAGGIVMIRASLRRQRPREGTHE